ncbi:MAG: cell division protein FtsL [Burkholderiaceae bacterium]|jgi:cell division protein FtsL|nr:cell division protein FtsL [Burkholderiaceae bacterium]
MKTAILSVLLVVALMLCALLLIHTRNQSRRLYAELNAEQARSRQLDEEYAQLQLEQSNLSKASRIEMIARQNLGMVPASTGNTRFLTIERK